MKRKEAAFREEKAGASEDPWRNESLQGGQGSASQGGREKPEDAAGADRENAGAAGRDQGIS